MSEALGVPDTLCAGASAMFLQEVLGQYPITKRRLTSLTVLERSKDRVLEVSGEGKAELCWC